MDGIKVRLAMAGLLTAIAVGTVAAPVTLAATTSCRVRNVTQDVNGHSFAAMVKSALDGDHLTVRGTCLARDVVIDADLTIRGAGDSRAVLDARGERRGLYIRRGATVTLRHLAITGRRSTVDAAGISNRGALTLIDSVVRGNRGGGIGNEGTTVLRCSVVRGDTANSKEGGKRNLMGQVTLRRSSSVTVNTAGEAGGGIDTVSLYPRTSPYSPCSVARRSPATPPTTATAPRPADGVTDLAAACDDLHAATSPGWQWPARVHLLA